MAGEVALTALDDYVDKYRYKAICIQCLPLLNTVLIIELRNARLYGANNSLHLLQLLLRIPLLHNFPHKLDRIIIRPAIDLGLHPIHFKRILIQAILGRYSILIGLEHLKLLHIELYLIVTLFVDLPLELVDRFVEVVVIEDELDDEVGERLPVEVVVLEQALDFVEAVEQDDAVFEHLAELLEVLLDSVDGYLRRVDSIVIFHP